ncbi:phenylacetate--CoA ligase [Pullulanibacillus sp. KACC 23026]|uniref:phenylacetate--CoA ligase family protein n=1 Tax=Pullulanibacillus sp. KACC 23026 TaxID=3028315 RepID=UPI0023B1F8FD|nr:phenylacetate--CoA ligase [Pullulanibacillus sp. KACC 23026]WEG11495.1 phenylacetate--CoA ligase [Pullulanibacillus sp. KACC 23026]
MIFNYEAECMPQSNIRELQLERLKQTVNRVFNNVPFYKTKFLEKGIEPSQITTLESIKRLPFTVKQDLRDHYPFGLFAVEQKDIIRLHASSGTKGKPTLVGYTKNDLDNWSELMARAFAAAGGEPGMVMHNAVGYGMFTGGLGCHYGSERLGMTTVPISGGNTERQILMIEDLKPTIISGTPSYVLNIAETMEKMGKDPKGTSLKYGLMGAEPWSQELKLEIEKRIGIKAMDLYGLSEVMGPGVSSECLEAQNGLHIAEDHFFVEVIDPTTGENVPDGVEGELVITSLTKEALPIIRYRTGDIATLYREPCSCGRTTTRMSRVKGRIDDMLIIRGVNVFPSEIESTLLQIDELAPHYQLVLTKNGALDQVTLFVEISKERFQRGIDNKNLISKIEKLLKSQCLVNISVRILEPESIPRSEGKAIRVVDKRKEELIPM